MLMTAPSGGDTFLGNSGFTYTAAAGVAVEIGGGDVAEALARNWTEIPYPITQTGSTTTTAESFGARPSATGAINTLAINAALALAGTVTLNTPGTYTVACSTAKATSPGTPNPYNVALVIPSNTRFIVGPGVRLIPAAGTVNPVLIQNSDIVGGNVNIEIAGGIWDGNAANITRTDGATFASILRWFQKIDNLYVHDSTITNVKAWADGLAALTNFKFSNLTYDDTTVDRSTFNNFGGVNFLGPNNNGVVEHITGNCLDDLVALNSDVSTISSSIYVNCMAGYGPITNICISDLRSTAAGVWHMLRIQDTTANPVSNVTVRGMNGYYLEAAMVLGSSSNPSGGGTLRNIEISDVNMQLFGTANIVGMVRIVGSYESLTLRNVKRVVKSTETALKPLIEQLTQVQVPAGGSLVIDGCELISSTAAAGMNVINFVNGTVKSLRVTNCKVEELLTAGGAGQSQMVNVNSGATITDLKIIGCTVTNLAFIFINGGTVSVAKLIGNTHTGPTTPGSESIRLNGTQPDVALIGNTINLANGGSGTTNGIVKLNGAAGTTVIRANGNNFNNAANVNLARAASEVIRWDGLDVPVPNALLTEALGDLFRDSSNSNAPYRCSTAPSTFTAL